MTDEAAINKALADEFDRLAKNIRELKESLTSAIIDGVADAIELGEEDHMGNYSQRFHPAQSVKRQEDGTILVEWTNGEATEKFAIKLDVVLR